MNHKTEKTFRFSHIKSRDVSVRHLKVAICVAILVVFSVARARVFTLKFLKQVQFLYPNEFDLARSSGTISL